jgi:hypothetical protein
MYGDRVVRKICPFCGCGGAVCSETERVCIERQQEVQPQSNDHLQIWVLALLLVGIAVMVALIWTGT